MGYYIFTMKAYKNSSKIIAGLHRSFNLFTLGYIKSKNAYLMKNFTHFLPFRRQEKQINIYHVFDLCLFIYTNLRRAPFV